MELSHESGMTWVEQAILLDESFVIRICLLSERLWHGNFESSAIRGCNPLALVIFYGGSALIEEHVPRILLGLAAVDFVHWPAEGLLGNFCGIKRSYVTIVKLNPDRCCASCRTRSFANVRIVVAALTCAGMYEDTDKVKHVLLVGLRWIAKVINMIHADINGRRELEIVINLPSTEIAEIEFEALQVQNQVVRYILEAGPMLISLSLVLNVA